MLEYPHFTRPQVFEGRPIPEVLVSGDHAKIAAWRRARGRTADQDPPARPVGGLGKPENPVKKGAQLTGDKPPSLSTRTAPETGQTVLFAAPCMSAMHPAHAETRRRRYGEFRMNVIQQLEQEQIAKLSASKTIPDFEPGDTLLVNVKVEGRRAHPRAGL